MRDQLRNDITIALLPFTDLTPQELRMRIDMILANYDVQKAELALTVYEGDVNDQILIRFLSSKVAQGCSQRTVSFYKNSIRKTLEKMGKPYCDVTADDVRLYIANRIYRDHVSKTTCNNERRNLSAFYAWLQREEILLKNPMNKVDVVKTNKKKKKAFDQMEIEKIRDACRSKKETAIVEVLLSTWARVSEVVQIRIDDIHGGKLIVHGKGSKDREVYLNAKAILAIKNYLDERSDDNPYMFPRAKYAGDIAKMCKGKARKLERNWHQDPMLVHPEEHTGTSTIESILRSIGRCAGVPGTHPHRFRRTGATMALRNGMPLIQVSKLLGHENIGTTQIYLDVSDEELEQAHHRYVI